MDNIKRIVVVGSLAWAVVLSFVALMLPPRGEIDGSVLILLAQVLVLIATVLGFQVPSIVNGYKDRKTLRQE